MEVVGGKKRKELGPGEESNNLMWLLDFKLDFFNESEASSKFSNKVVTIFYTEILTIKFNLRSFLMTETIETKQ